MPILVTALPTKGRPTESGFRSTLDAYRGLRHAL